MINLIKSELFKLSKSFGFKTLFLFNMTAILTAVLLLNAGAKGTGYKAIIVSLSYILHHAVIGYLFVAIFFCGEFTNRTFGMSLLCGYSRRKVFLSKILVSLAGLLLLFLIYTAAYTIVMSLGNGFGNGSNVLTLLLCGILGNVAMGAVMILVSVIFEKAIATIGIGIGITYSLLWMSANTKDNMMPILKYTYSYQIQQLQFWEGEFSLCLYLLVTSLTIILALLASFFVFEKIELK